MKKLLVFLIVAVALFLGNRYMFGVMDDYTMNPIEERMSDDGVTLEQVHYERDEGSFDINARSVMDAEDDVFYDPDVVQEIYDRYIDYLEVADPTYPMYQSSSEEEVDEAFSDFKEIAEKNINMYTSDYGRAKIREDIDAYTQIPTPEYIEQSEGGIYHFHGNDDMNEFDEE